MMKQTHGGDIYSREILYDFSANINPLGMPQGVKNVLAEHIDEYSRYPDINCTKLKKAISAHENVSVDCIVCGNGAADLIYRIVRSLKPKTALVPAPTFSEYGKVLDEIGCEIEYHLLSESDDFTLGEDMLKKIAGRDMLFICNPNNPVGNIVSNGLMGRIAKRCAECGCTLVIDECFMDFVREKSSIGLLPNVIILKAFTKIYAMAGLRLGYMLCADTEIVKQIENCGQCWSVSVPAQLAGVAALSEREYVEKTLLLIEKEREYLTNSLIDLGFTVYPSAANFILFKCEQPLDELLLSEKIAVRSCDNYIGLRYGFFRIAVRGHNENEALIKAIERVI